MLYKLYFEIIFRLISLSLLQAALLTRTAIGGYRHCHSILKTQVCILETCTPTTDCIHLSYWRCEASHPHSYQNFHVLRQQAGSRSKHNVGAVKLGFGGFSLAISLLPPRLLRLLSVLGFPCDRAAGLDSIDQSLQGGGLRAPVGGVYASNHCRVTISSSHSVGMLN